jgi:hypothetical protein
MNITEYRDDDHLRGYPRPTPRPATPDTGFFYIGVDPGQAVDPTAIAVVQRIANANGKPTFRCGHLERLPLATPYPGVVQHVRRLVSKEPFLGHSELVLDLTGVGRPVADLFQAEGLRPVKVSITAGDSETQRSRRLACRQTAAGLDRAGAIARWPATDPEGPPRGTGPEGRTGGFSRQRYG